MAASAIAGKSGRELHGYRSYLSTDSVAAWHPLPELGFSLATRQDTSEAYRPLRVLWLTFNAILILLAGSIVGLATSHRAISPANDAWRRRKKPLKPLANKNSGANS